jgi:transcriptional regulator GlxA family with amidase domain
MIDFAGPLEVFQDVSVPGRPRPFRLFTVSSSTSPIRATGGMQIVPDFAFEAAPGPRVIVIPAQRGGPETVAWIRAAGAKADVVMSVCTGAFILGATGMLDGKAATTHHDFYERFEARFPRVSLQRGRRFVRSDDTLYTAGGLSSGIDLALHVVERYFGRAVAQQTADYMEYEGTGWKRGSD